VRLGVLFSGGKDSTYAMMKAMKEHEVVCLISVISENPESYMFHTPNIALVKLQAEAIGLPLVIKTTPGVKEEELHDLERAIETAKKKYRIEGIVTGALASVYQASRIQKICDKLGLGCVNPLWGMDQVRLLHEILEAGLEVIISGVFAEPFDESWLGRRLDERAVSELEAMAKKYRINPAGEGGEIETTVLDAPFFSKKLVILEARKEYKEYAGVYRVIKAVLGEK